MLTTTTDISKINKALENSFAAIKSDMDAIRLSLNSQSEKATQLRKEIEVIRTSSVSKDKINVLKIKIGELNEDLKKLWDIEKQLKALDPSKAKKALSEDIDELNAKLIAMNMKINDVSKKSATESQLKSLVGEVNSELDALAQEIKNTDVQRDQLQKDAIDKYTAKLAEKIDTTNDALADLRKDTKQYVHKGEVKDLLASIGDDFDAVRKDIDGVRKVNKSFVREKEIQSLLGDINNEFDKVKKELDGINKASKQFAKTKQLDAAQGHIAKDLDAVRADLGDLHTANKKFIKEDEIKAVIKELSKELDSYAQKVHAMKQDIKKNNKSFVTANQAKDLAKDINDEFDSVRKELQKLDEIKQLSSEIDEVHRAAITKKELDAYKGLIEDVQKDVRNLSSESVSRDEFERELKSLDKDLERIEKKKESSTKGASVILEAYEPAKRVKHAKHRRSYAFANFMIFVSFLFLIGSIISYYTGQISPMDNFAIAAVMAFVIGMFTRAYVIIKTK